MQNDIVKPPKAASDTAVPAQAVQQQQTAASESDPALGAEKAIPTDVPSGDIQINQEPAQNEGTNEGEPDALGAPDQHSQPIPQTEKQKVSKPRGPGAIIAAAFLLCVVFAGLAVYIQMK